MEPNDTHSPVDSVSAAELSIKMQVASSDTSDIEHSKCSAEFGE